MYQQTDLFLTSSNFDNEVGDAKILQSLPVSDVLEFGIGNVQTQHWSMRLKDLTRNLWRLEVGNGRHTSKFVR